MGSASLPPRPHGPAALQLRLGGGLRAACLAGSVAATGSHRHVPVLLQDDVGVVVEVEHRDGVQLGGGAARLGHVLRVHEMDLERNRQAMPLLPF